VKIRLIAAAAMIMVPLGYIVPGASAQTGDAQVRIAHFSPDAPAVDVYVDAKKVSNNVAYEKASNYLALPAGSHVVEIRATGTAPDSTPAVKASVDVAAGKAYTVAAIGKLANIQAKVYTDDNTPPPAGKVKLRVLHNAPDVPAIDVAVKGGSTVVSKLSFPEASAYMPLDPGTYDLEVRAAGTTTVLLASTVVLQPGGVYTVAAIGGADKPPKLRGLIDVPATGTATSTTAAAVAAGGTPTSVVTGTTKAPATTAVPATTKAPATTAAATTLATTVPATTRPAPTTAVAATLATTAPATTVPNTTAVPDTTAAPDTTAVPDTTSAPDTTSVPDTTATTDTTPIGGVPSGGGGLSGGGSALGLVALGGTAAAALALALQRRRRYTR